MGWILGVRGWDPWGMAGMTVRLSVPEDAEAVERLRLAGWQTAYRGILPDDYLDALRVDVPRRRRHLEGLPADISDEVAVADGAVAGWVASGPCRDPDRHGARYGEIFACYVHPDWWRKGTGRLLMDHAIGALAQAATTSACGCSRATTAPAGSTSRSGSAPMARAN